MEELTKFQRDLMFVMASVDGQKGLEIKERLEQFYDTEIHHGRLYPNLDDLTERGYVEKGTLDDRSNSYNLTQQGEDAIEALQEWQDRMLAGDVQDLRPDTEPEQEAE